MKQLIISGILFLNSFSLIAQNFVGEGNLWRIKVDAIAQPDVFLYYKVEGDTIVNGQTYKKIFYSTDDLVTWSPQVFFIRQENNIVYKLFDTPGETENIIYEFDLMVGDALVENQCDEGGQVIDVEEITLLNGETRDQYRFGSNPQTRWINYIGTLEGDVFLPGSAVCFTDPVFELECFVENGILKYTSNPDIECSFLVSNHDIGISENGLDISPNPSSEYIRIEMDDLTSLDEISVYSSIGELLFQYDEIKSDIISISQLEKGIYFFKFRIGKQMITKRVIKI